MTLFIRGRKIRGWGEGTERAEEKWAEKSERNGNEECKSAKRPTSGNVHVRIHVHDNDCNTPRDSPRGPYKTGEWLMVLMLRLIR